MAGWRAYLPMQAAWPAAQPLIDDLRTQANCAVDGALDSNTEHYLLYHPDGGPAAYARLHPDGLIDSLCINLHDGGSMDDAILDAGAVLLGYIATEVADRHPRLRISPPTGWRHVLMLLDPDAEHYHGDFLLASHRIAQHWRLAGLSEATLGKTPIHWELIKSEEIASVVVQMARQAERCLRIFSPALSHPVFDNAHLADAISALARRSRYTDVRILVSDSRPMVQRGHALLALHRRLSSNVPILKLPYETHEFTDTVVIADDCGVIAKPEANDESLFACFNNRPQARALMETFDYLWQRGMTDPEIRGLAL